MKKKKKYSIDLELAHQRFREAMIYRADGQLDLASEYLDSFWLWFCADIDLDNTNI